jgi:hypothetical protein
VGGASAQPSWSPNCANGIRTSTVADIYEHPVLADLAQTLDAMAAPTGRTNASVSPVPRDTQVAQVLGTVVVRSIGALRWLTWIGLGLLVAHRVVDAPWLPSIAWGWVLAGWLLLINPFGRVLLGAAAARLVLRGVGPGRYPRGGRVHLRLWLAERLVDELGATNLSAAPLVRVYAKLLDAGWVVTSTSTASRPSPACSRSAPGAPSSPRSTSRGHWLDGRPRVHRRDGGR